MGYVCQPRVSIMLLFFAVTFWSLRFLVLAFIGLNIARPVSPEFLSSVIIWTLGAHAEKIAAYVLTIMASSIFQAYILICYVQVCTLFFGLMVLFMFTMSDVVAIKPY